MEYKLVFNSTKMLLRVQKVDRLNYIKYFPLSAKVSVKVKTNLIGGKKCGVMDDVCLKPTGSKCEQYVIAEL